VGSEERGAPAGIVIERVDELSQDVVQGLADVLVDCVAGGASVGFMIPLSLDKAAAFWHGLSDDIAAGRRLVFVARDEGGIVGTVQLVMAAFENQPHRADLAKMLVHRRVRRQGVGAALMRAAEQHALGIGRTVLVLDTVTGSDAERLYKGLGWLPGGIIPDYALYPDGVLTSTSFYYRKLGP
jgi:GNAT superfamily N-acetyltransferase